MRKASAVSRNKLLLPFWVCPETDCCAMAYWNPFQIYIENVAITDYFFIIILYFFNSYFTQENWTMDICCDQNLWPAMKRRIFLQSQKVDSVIQVGEQQNISVLPMVCISLSCPWSVVLRGHCQSDLGG